MELNRKILKGLISEAIKELVEEQPAGAPEAAGAEDDKGQSSQFKNLEGIESRIEEELKKYLASQGTALKKLVMTNTIGKSPKVKARILTVIAAAFGISAEETRQDLSSAGEQMKGG